MLIIGYIITHIDTHTRRVQQAQESKRTKGEQTLSPTLMDKECVPFCVQTFKRVTVAPAVLEICADKVESQTVNYD